MLNRSTSDVVRLALGVPSRLLVVALLSTTASCGNLTAGGATGEARIILSGDAPDPTPGFLSTASVIQLEDGPGSTDHDDSPEGEVEAEFRMYLVAETGALVELTEGEARVRVDLEGIEEPEVASRVIDATGYSTLRIVFTEIEAEVDAGLIINGVPVTGEIRVELEDLTLTVDRALELDLSENEVVELLVDLNAAGWLQAVDPVTATVDPQVFADLITVTVR